MPGSVAFARNVMFGVDVRRGWRTAHDVLRGAMIFLSTWGRGVRYPVQHAGRLRYAPPARCEVLKTSRSTGGPAPRAALPVDTLPRDGQYSIRVSYLRMCLHYTELLARTSRGRGRGRAYGGVAMGPGVA